MTPISEQDTLAYLTQAVNDATMDIEAEMYSLAFEILDRYAAGTPLTESLATLSASSGYSELELARFTHDLTLHATDAPAWVRSGRER